MIYVDTDRYPSLPYLSPNHHTCDIGIGKIGRYLSKVDLTNCWFIIPISSDILIFIFVCGVLIWYLSAFSKWRSQSNLCGFLASTPCILPSLHDALPNVSVSNFLQLDFTPLTWRTDFCPPFILSERGTVPTSLNSKKAGRVEIEKLDDQYNI